MKKPALKKQGPRKEYTGNDVKRYLGSLSEDFQHRVSAIGEQHVGVMQKLDEHGKKLDIHTEMIGKMMLNMEVMKGDIQEIKTDLKQKVDRSEFARLERRVISLESLVHAGRSRK